MKFLEIELSHILMIQQCSPDKDFYFNKRFIYIHVFEKILLFVEKDVTRTDRTHKFFEGECNPNLQVLNDCLMTYCMYNFALGKPNSQCRIANYWWFHIGLFSPIYVLSKKDFCSSEILCLWLLLLRKYWHVPYVENEPRYKNLRCTN